LIQNRSRPRIVAGSQSRIDPWGARRRSADRTGATVSWAPRRTRCPRLHLESKVVRRPARRDGGHRMRSGVDNARRSARARSAVTRAGAWRRPQIAQMDAVTGLGLDQSPLLSGSPCADQLGPETRPIQTFVPHCSDPPDERSRTCSHHLLRSRLGPGGVSQSCPNNRCDPQIAPFSDSIVISSHE